MTDLTDNWKDGKLKNGWYFIKFSDEIYPDYYNGYFIQTGDKDGIEVLAHCDYEKLKRLEDEKESLIKLLKECENELKIMRMLSLTTASAEALKECDNLIAHINAVIGESEE